MPCPTLRLALTVLLVGATLACRREPPVLAPKSVVAKVAGVELPGAATATALPSSVTATQLAASGTSTDELFPPPPPPPDVPLSLDDAPRVFARMEAEMRKAGLRFPPEPGRLAFVNWLYRTRELPNVPPGGGRHELLLFDEDGRLRVYVLPLRVEWVREDGECRLETPYVDGHMNHTAVAACDSDDAALLDSLAALATFNRRRPPEDLRAEVLTTHGDSTTLRMVSERPRLRFFGTIGADGLALTPAGDGVQVTLLPRADGILARRDGRPAWVWHEGPTVRTSNHGDPQLDPEERLPALRLALQGADLLAAGRAVDAALAERKLTSAGPGTFEILSTERGIEWKAVFVPVLAAPDSGPRAAIVRWRVGDANRQVEAKPEQLAQAVERAGLPPGCHLVQILGPSLEDAGKVVAVLRACAP